MENNNIPFALERELDFMGVLTRLPKPINLQPDYDPKETMKKSAFRMPILDENGEPDF